MSQSDLIEVITIKVSGVHSILQWLILMRNILVDLLHAGWDIESRVLSDAVLLLLEVSIMLRRIQS